MLVADRLNLGYRRSSNISVHLFHRMLLLGLSTYATKRIQRLLP